MSKVLSEKTRTFSYKHLYLSVCFAMTLFLLPALVNSESRLTATKWGPYRGVTAKLNLSEVDIAELASTGANLIRLMANDNPLISKEPPYDIIIENIAKMDQIISWCEKYGIRVVIDPHTVPGTSMDTTILMQDDLWKSFEWHDHTIRLWDFLARHYKNYGDVIAGYDLLNEPAMPEYANRNSPADWNCFSRKIINTIRKYDPKTPT